MEINRIYNESCIDTMKRMDDGVVDLIVTSPPYNIDIDYDNYNDNLSWEDYLKSMEKWLVESYRVLKDDGRICVNVLIDMKLKNSKTRVFPSNEFINIMQNVGLKINSLPIWLERHRVKYTARGSWMMASSPYIYNPLEMIIIGYKKQWKKKNKGESTISKKDFIEGTNGIWEIRADTRQLTKANFPVELPELCINLLTYKNDLVYDPFMGSGTTAVASMNLDRRFVGSEISKKYCKIAEERILNNFI